MFNVSVNDKKNIYRSKPVMNVDTVPKPLTYDYMPEGYPSKNVQTTTLANEEEVTFSKRGSNMIAQTLTLDIEAADKLTIIWDGVSYNATLKRVNDGHSEVLAFGNLGLVNLGDAEDYPFVCGMLGSSMVWTTADTATSHTIGIVRQRATYAPIDIKYMPKNFNVVFISKTGYIPTSCNVTYDELRGWVENNIPILSIYRRIDSNYTEIITTIRLDPDSLVLKTAINNGFTYNSDGTFSVVEET